MPGLPTQEFSPYVEGLFRELQPETVVEIGPDAQLRLMGRLGGLCGRYIGVALPDDCQRMQFAFSVLEDGGGNNLELMAGNATELSRLVPRADVILQHNVLLDLTGQDAQFLQSLRTGQRRASEAEFARLDERFRQARVQSFAECLKVARPGRILSFHRQFRTESMVEGITRRFGVAEEKISVVPLLYDGAPADDTQWDLVIVDNTSQA